MTEGIDQLVWVAALKPTTVGVAEYRDAWREYLEITVLHLTLRSTAKVGRLVELIHRAVPYPTLLVAEETERAHLSAGHKRWSQGEAGRTVLDGGIVHVEWYASADDSHWGAFREALPLAQQPQVSLLALYQGWIDTLLALQAARRTGTFIPPGSEGAAIARRDALKECQRLEAEISRLRAAAAKEKQIARQVELNLELKRIEAARETAIAKL
jgi:hypothetical protein